MMLRVGRGVLGVAVLMLLAPAALVGLAEGAAFITNGTVTLGINDVGNLNVFSTDPLTAGSAAYPGPSSGGVDPVGLRFNATGNDSTSPGCVCEGWGAAIASTGASGFANRAYDPIGGVNLSLISFTTDGVSATSVVDVDTGGGALLRVTHAYTPSASPNLYQVDVTITNTSGAAIAAGDLRYRRVMDWDVEPTEFNEFVTIAGLPATNLIFVSDQGFADANPLGTVGDGPGDVFPDIAGCGINVNFTDCGPDDHGSIFDFAFGPLADGASLTFTIFYGAAGTEAGALAALGAVGAEVFSFGQCDPSLNGACSPTTGTPNTFIFAFASVGGTPIPPVGVPVPGSLLLLGAGLAGRAAWRRLRKTT